MHVIGYANKLIEFGRLWRDNFKLIDNLNSISNDKISAVKAMYLTVGEDEAGGELKSFADLRNGILNKKISSPKLSSLIIADENHLSAIRSVQNNFLIK